MPDFLKCKSCHLFCFLSLYISFPPMGSSSTSLAYLTSCMFKFISFQEPHTHCVIQLYIRNVLYASFTVCNITNHHHSLTSIQKTSNSSFKTQLKHQLLCEHFSGTSHLHPQTCALSPTLLCALAPYAFLSLNNFFLIELLTHLWPHKSRVPPEHLCISMSNVLLRTFRPLSSLYKKAYPLVYIPPSARLKRRP